MAAVDCYRCTSRRSIGLHSVDIGGGFSDSLQSP